MNPYSSARARMPILPLMLPGRSTNADRHVGRDASKRSMAKTWPEMKFEKRIEMVHGAIVVPGI